MAVAWIGNRGDLVERAVEAAAGLLTSSRCPVFTFDTDIHGTRAAIALAERVGAAYDHVEGAALARETALFTDAGGMFVAPGEARRRADLLAIVGELPAPQAALVSELADTAPDLTGRNARDVFLIGEDASLPQGVDANAVRLVCTGAGLAGTLAGLRASCARRRVSTPVENFNLFAEALAQSKFAVFVVSGCSAGPFGLEMLQGLVSDINRRQRASVLFLPASEAGWGSALASAWATGFPLRTGFGNGGAEYDPWRFDTARMLEAGEADLHLWVSANGGRAPLPRAGAELIVLAKASAPHHGAAVTIAIGEPGADHDTVCYSSRTGTLAARPARASSEAPSAAAVLRSILAKLPVQTAAPC